VNGFLGSATLETAIGTAFLYLLLAVCCTAVVEWIATLLSARADTLRETIEHLLKDQRLAQGASLLEAFYGHPLVSTGIKEREHPSYLSPQAFSTAILDLAQTADECLGNLPEGPVRTSLLALRRKGKGDLDQLQAGVESWFNEAMRRASGNYQKRIRAWTVAIACGITIATNADTFVLLRQPGYLPGWSSSSLQMSPWAWLARLTGWTLTVGAISLGSPFWFDVLSRFVNLRNGGRSQTGE
jgi:hypothetical protein